MLYDADTRLPSRTNDLTGSGLAVSSIREVRVSHKSGPPVPVEQKNRVKQYLLDTHQLASSKLGRPFPVPSISFDLRGSTAGLARPGLWHVQLNSALLMQNEPEFARQVIPHELAHLYTRALFGKSVKPHGAEWQSVMVALGVRPDRTHRMDTSETRVQSRLYRYRCGCSLHELGAHRHSRLVKRKRTLICRCNACGTALEYTGEARVKGEWVQLQTSTSRVGVRRKTVKAEKAGSGRVLASQNAVPASVSRQIQSLIEKLRAEVPTNTFTCPRTAELVLGLLKAEAERTWPGKAGTR